MRRSFLISDTHFGHANFLNFKDEEGNKIRPFSSVEEMDALMIENWNRTVRPQDKVYHLGDFCLNRKSIQIAKKLNGSIVLIKGNHDIFKLKDYAPFFKDIRVYRVFPEWGILCSHIPVHETQMFGKWLLNCHGHIHQKILSDFRYKNCCVEHTNYSPISLESILDETAKMV